jgi:drug/metabolite transporter (DMT)-like permease
MVPVATLIVGVPVTGEVPSGAEWLGGALATLGLVVAMGVVRFGAEPRP